MFSRFFRRPVSLTQAVTRSLIAPVVIVALLGGIFGLGYTVAAAMGHPQAQFTTIEK